MPWAEAGAAVVALVVGYVVGRRGARRRRAEALRVRVDITYEHGETDDDRHTGMDSAG